MKTKKSKVSIEEIEAIVDAGGDPTPFFEKGEMRPPLDASVLSLLITNPNKYSTILDIGTMMTNAGLPPIFVDRAINLAKEFEGGFDLLVLWRDEQDNTTKNKILADIQKEIEELNNLEVQKK